MIIEVTGQRLIWNPNKDEWYGGALAKILNLDLVASAVEDIEQRALQHAQAMFGDDLKVVEGPMRFKRPVGEDIVEGLSIAGLVSGQFTEGGPGSGNWGHAGVKGSRGGSAPGMGGGKALDARLTKSLYGKAQAAEKQLTPAIQGAVEGVGGSMYGLDFRLKRPESIQGKLYRDAEESGTDIRTAAKNMTDTVRYTAIFDANNFVEGVNDVQTRLEQDGWQQYDTKYRNYWTPGNPYQGYNTVMINPKTGMRFELQYHTPKSIQAKEKAHKLYEEARELPAGDPKRLQLERQMVGLWDSVDRPANWENLPGLIIKPR